jgi:hypothetical protein
MARVGSKESEEYAVDGSVNLSPHSGEELFLYLNNVVVGVPGLLGAFYYQPGGIKVSLRRWES